jgi:hypothetical protein
LPDRNWLDNSGSSLAGAKLINSADKLNTKYQCGWNPDKPNTNY